MPSSSRRAALAAVVALAPSTWTAAGADRRYRQRFHRDRRADVAAARAKGKAILSGHPFLNCPSTRVAADSFVAYYADDPKMNTPTLLTGIKVPTLVIAGSAGSFPTGGFSAGLAILLSKTITRPIALLSEAVSAVGAGHLDVAVPVRSRDESGHLAARFNNMVQQLNELNQALQIAATVDKLTGAANRGRIEEELQAEMERSTRYNTPLALILFDLDHFKQVNDHHGHLAGDMVLKTVAAVVRQVTRTNDILGRWGGEEFLLLAPATNQAQATHLAEKIRQSIACSPIEGMDQVTVSCGVAQLLPGDREVDLIKRADDALYRAKRLGRNRVETGQPA